MGTNKKAGLRRRMASLKLRASFNYWASSNPPEWNPIMGKTMGGKVRGQPIPIKRMGPGPDDATNMKEQGFT